MYNVIVDRPPKTRIGTYHISTLSNATRLIREELLRIKFNNILTNDEIYHIDFLIEMNALEYKIFLSNGKLYKGWVALA